MPSRSNDEDKDAAVKAYGAPLGPAAPAVGAQRRKPTEATDAQRRTAIAADVAASRKPVASKPAPAAKPGSPEAFSVFRAARDIKARRRVDRDIE